MLVINSIKPKEGPRGPVVSTLGLSLSAESRGCGYDPRKSPGRCMSLSCVVKFPVTILYGAVFCSFDEDLLADYYIKLSNLTVCSINTKRKP